MSGVRNFRSPCLVANEQHPYPLQWRIDALLGRSKPEHFFIES